MLKYSVTSVTGRGAGDDAVYRFRDRLGRPRPVAGVYGRTQPAGRKMTLYVLFLTFAMLNIIAAVAAVISAVAAVVALWVALELARDVLR
jgi:hypothetical protein